jgi:hypothetical protein
LFHLTFSMHRAGRPIGEETVGDRCGSRGDASFSATAIIAIKTPPPGARAAMAEIFNLNRARKAKAKTADKAASAQNRAKFGRSKVDKALETARAEKLTRALDGAKREE